MKKVTTSTEEVDVKETVTVTKMTNVSPTSTGPLAVNNCGTAVVVEDGCTSSFARQMFRSWIFWLLIVISIVAALICWWIAGTSDAINYWNSLTKVSWADNLWVLAIFQLIAFIILAWATFLAAERSRLNGDVFCMSLVYVTYGLQILLTIIAFAVLFRQKQPYVAFFFMLVLLFVTVIEIYFCSRSGSQASVWIMLVYTIWLCVTTFVAWNVYSSNA